MFDTFEIGTNFFFAVIAGAVVIYALASVFFIVQPKSVVTVTRFGKFVRVGRSGLNVKLPFGIEQLDVKLSTALLHRRDEVTVKTSNNAYVSMPIQVFYEANEDKIYEAAYNLSDADGQIVNLASKEVRAHATSMTLDELFQDKDDLEKEVKQALEEFVSRHGWRIQNIVIDEPTPSEEIQKASNDVIASERQQDAAKAKAEAIRLERVGQAQADAEALNLRAKAFADSRAVVAEGMSKAASHMHEHVPHLTQAQIIQVLEGIDWRDTLNTCSKGPGTIIIDTARNGHGLADLMAGISSVQPPQSAPAGTAASAGSELQSHKQFRDIEQGESETAKAAADVAAV